MRLAHFSDIHVTLSPLSEAASELMGKRMAGTINYYVGGRSRHFKGVEARIATLLEDVDAQGVDHAVCTGDITAMSTVAEFARCAAIFGARMQQPERYTVVPGNHDRYTPRAASEKYFEAHFSSLAGGTGTFPFIKRLAPGVTLIGLDPNRPTSMLDSSGLLGARQRSELRAMLTDPSLKSDFVVVALHYGILRENGRPDATSHGLEDYREALDILDSRDRHADLVLHGHTHKHYVVKAERTTMVCAGSATDLHLRCGYHVYDVDPDRKTFTVQRRVWDVAAQRYTAL
ncbi:MAG: metallophosphoesterase [Myxococcota bacterium]